jgi:hypothetical protein
MGAGKPLNPGLERGDPREENKPTASDAAEGVEGNLKEYVTPNQTQPSKFR